ncbi:MAG: HAMP domain-containing histidine kinase [Rhizobacter sp.]|nr:HAMP domain-containing histidine kinase [Rhizobacter sp.]
MRTLTLRIYLTVVAVLLLFAFGSGWLFQRQIEQERQNTESAVSDRMAAWGDLIQRSLPGIDAPVADQSAALLDWSQRLRVPLALDDVRGQRIVASESFLRRIAEGGGGRQFSIRLDDGRTLWVMRPGLRKGMRGPGGAGPREAGDRGLPGPDTPFIPAAWQRGIGPVVVLVLLFIAVAAGAWPAVRHLTRRLQALKKGVEQFGAGELHHRVEVSGRDEVAAVAASFNLAAERVETLVRSHQSLLANASHELRSPLARMKMAVSMLDDASPEQQQRLKREIDTNVAELDALVEEVLLASRLDAVQRVDRRDPVDLLALAAEEGARVDAAVDGASVTVPGDERLLRRALRNLLENARRYAGDDVVVLVAAQGNQASVQVCDRGPGVPEAQRERIFEAFYRLPGHAEQAGGVGLGLSLVKQIAERHGGSVRCTAREGGGSCFELRFPRA